MIDADVKADIRLLLVEHQIEKMLVRVDRIEEMLLQAISDGDIHPHIDSPRYHRTRNDTRPRINVGGDV